MRGVFSMLVAAALVATSLGPLDAQAVLKRQTASVAIGDRVRFWMPEAYVATYGMVTAWAADSVAIDGTWYPVESVARLQVQRRPAEVASNAFIGGGLGAVWGLSLVASCLFFTPEDARKAWVLAGVVTVLGVVTGAVRKGREARWEDVPLHRLTLLPPRDRRFGIGFTIPF